MKQMRGKGLGVRESGIAGLVGMVMLLTSVTTVYAGELSAR